MSLYNIVNQSIEQITEKLALYGAELRNTKYQDTYLIKFKPNCIIDDEAINCLKGLIFNHKTSQIYSLTYPVPLEIKELDQSNQQKLVNQLDKSNYEIQEAINGTLFRYSYFDEEKKWVLSTNSKEDANDAYWMNNISLAKQFESVKSAKINTDIFDKNYVYLFVMCHPLNVIVVNYDESKIYHVATYDRSTMTEINCDIGISKPQNYQTKTSTESSFKPSDILTQTNQTITKPVTSAGYMVIVQENGICRRYRFENANYTKARQLRGNSSNIDYTIISIMLNENKELINDFLLYYPIYLADYEMLKNRMTNLLSKLFREYGKRYKEAIKIHVHPRHHKFLAEMHQKIYLGKLKPTGKTMQYNDIQLFVLQQTPERVLYLLNYIYDNPQ